MKTYLRILATSSLVIFGLSVGSAVAAQATSDTTSTDTSSTKSKRKSRKMKDTTGTAATTPAAATPAASATPAAPATPATKTAKGKVPTPTQNASDADIAAAKTAGKVWVNTGSDTKAYHTSSSKWYGKTKQGTFMTEDDAKKAGYHASKSESGSKKS